MAEDCLFCSFAQDEKDCDKLYEDEHVLAFLDTHPIRPGHTLIIPKRHFDYFENLPRDTAARIMALGQDFAKAMKAAYQVPLVGFLYAGHDIDHAHVHVIPLHEPGDITSKRYMVDLEVSSANHLRASDSDLAAEALILKRHLQP